MLRGAIAAARACRRVVVFLEPIALYHERDLYVEGDNLWLCDYPPPSADAANALLPGNVGVYEPEQRDLLIVSYANGLRLSLRAARVLREQHGIHARVVDVRWLNPLPFDALERHARECGRVLVADECRATGGGIADAVIANLFERGFRGAMGSVRAVDTYVPLGAATSLVLVREQDIVDAARGLAR
jgi:2-oxoisovalerate dehydrogenase E1 component